MAAFSLGAALSAAAPTLIGFGAQGLFSAVAAERERAWSEKMYNKYNSPAALVRQYQEAGINPALMFGQSSIPAPTSSSMAALPENPTGGFVEMLGKLMDLELLDANKQKIAAETRAANASAESSEIENQFKPELFRQNLAKGEIDIQQGRLGIDKTLAEIDKLVAEKSNLAADTDLKAAQKILAFANAALAQMQTDESYSRIGVNNAQALLITQQRAHEEFDNYYRRTFGSSPDSGLFQQVLGVVRNTSLDLNTRIPSEIDSFTDGLKSLGRKALFGVARMSRNAKERWNYLNSRLR